jgi:hypothetical protein
MIGGGFKLGLNSNELNLSMSREKKQPFRTGKYTKSVIYSHDSSAINPNQEPTSANSSKSQGLQRKRTGENRASATTQRNNDSVLLKSIMPNSSFGSVNLPNIILPKNESDHERKMRSTVEADITFDSLFDNSYESEHTLSLLNGAHYLLQATRYIDDDYVSRRNSREFHLNEGSSAFMLLQILR